MRTDERPTTEFDKLLAGRDEVDLVDLMLEFAGDAYDDLDAAACRAELAELERRAAQRLADLSAGDGVRARLASISRFLYDDERFAGNEGAYYDPRNSYLNEVLLRRRGIPISLGVVYMAVAAGAGLRVYGVPAPAHFVLGCDDDGETWYVDPFDAGRVMAADECRRRLATLSSSGAPPPTELFRPATHLEIAVRVLRNLKFAYVRIDRWREALPVQQRLAQLVPGAAAEQRDLGLIYLRTGDAPRALGLLRDVQRICGEEDAAELEPYIRAAQRLSAELN